MECAICLQDCEINRAVDTTLCMHQEKICTECIKNLKSKECPFCRVSWESLFPEVKQVSTLNLSIALLLSLWEQDMKLLNKLISKFGDELLELPTDSALALMGSQESWDLMSSDLRKVAKETLLKATVNFKYQNDDYVEDNL